MVGRLLRWKTQDAARETPERQAERMRYRAASEQAIREREARFPTLTPENAAEAIAWQAARIKELMV